jgi:hypothetical protein
MVEMAQKQLVTGIARDVIAQIAPQELPLFSITSETYFKNPNKPLGDQQGKDEMLGFGVETAAAIFISPIVLAIANGIIQSLTEDFIPEKTKGIINKIFKTKRTKKEKDKQVTLPLSYTRDQLQQIRDEIVTKVQRQSKCSKLKAEEIADAVVGNLFLANK